VSDQIQPPEEIGPADQQPKEDPVLSDPAKMDYKQGREFLKNGEYNQAANAFHNALKGFEQKGDDIGVANASDRLGDVCMAKEQYQLAIDNYMRAYEICEKEEDSFSILALNNKLASAYRGLGQFDNSLKILFDIVDHHSDLNNPKGVVEVLETVAEVYLEKGEKMRAADTLKTISSIHANFRHSRQAEEFARKAAQLEES